MFPPFQLKTITISIPCIKPTSSIFKPALGDPFEPSMFAEFPHKLIRCERPRTRLFGQEQPWPRGLRRLLLLCGARPEFPAAVSQEHPRDRAFPNL
jgi:hypothetical protein